VGVDPGLDCDVIVRLKLCLAAYPLTFAVLIIPLLSSRTTLLLTHLYRSAPSAFS
jgi:hypothetical protein